MRIVMKKTALCPGNESVKDIPALSEWGLIALAVAIGIIGFVVFRRRKAAA